jgi:hypothetical protein
VRRAHGSPGCRQVWSVILVLNYDVLPFVRRIYDVPTAMIVAEQDDLEAGHAVA